MKAVEWTRYGAPDVLKLAEVEKPVPKAGEVLVKVHATSVTAGECEMRSFKVRGLFWLPLRLWLGIFKPRKKLLGQEFAGEIEAVGTSITQFKPGQRVFGTTGINFGAYAQYLCVPEKAGDGVVATMPKNLSFEQAAPVPVAGLEALHFLRTANIQQGQQILIVGSGGSIGTYALQLAKHYGATVTAVDSTQKLDMLRELGADLVVDYTKEDYLQTGKTYDAILDVVGKASFSRAINTLKPKGHLLLANPGLLDMLRGSWVSATSGKTVVAKTAASTTEDLLFLNDLIETGKLKPIIDRTYTLEQTAEAHKYAETGDKKGNIVITVPH
ncbi:MAG: NAD(P)-dependent alcohol dehydrogenase [Candidatus Bathyarchaeota archaeon]|nr:NAD(P)-dependent alcohol dehydrogenase [Candidatus Bathyarchaeota archaeon]